MDHDEIGSRIVSAVGESGACELLDALTRSETDRAALIGRLAIRDDAAWLAELLTVSVAGTVTYTLDQAKATFAGYCLATKPFEWRAPKGTQFGAEPLEKHVPRWAYEVYDEILPASPGHGSDLDLLVTVGLNARIQSQDFVSMRAVSEDAFEALAAVEEDATFWDLSRDEIEHPTEGSASWFLHRAWWLMQGAPGISVARAHKVLHHKRPTLVPLVDNQTLRPLMVAARQSSHEDYWLAIHDDLSSQREEFRALEEWCSTFLGPRMPLGRLRLHDILLWCDVTGNRNDAEEAGRDALRS